MGSTGMWSKWHCITAGSEDFSCLFFWTVKVTAELHVTQSQLLSVEFFSFLSED